VSERDSTFEVKVDIAEFVQAVESYLESVDQGKSHILTHDGEPCAAVISMPEYAQLQQFKTLLKEAGSTLL
jgi:prevent-host-death family protein